MKSQIRNLLVDSRLSCEQLWFRQIHCYPSTAEPLELGRGLAVASVQAEGASFELGPATASSDHRSTRSRWKFDTGD